MNGLLSVDNVLGVNLTSVSTAERKQPYQSKVAQSENKMPELTKQENKMSTYLSAEQLIQAAHNAKMDLIQTY